MEFVDRTFKLKGMAVTAMCSAFILFEVIIMAFSLHGVYSHPQISLGEKMVLSTTIAAVLGGLSAMMWMLLLRKDLFQYTHYPVRFNRITRKIYFFRHNGPGGVTVVPWGSPYAFFHIGRGAQNRELRDLRCHLLDRNQQIQQTFTIGHFWEHEDDIREPWALICRYMQDGPENCYDDPRDRVITLSSDPTIRNCWLMVILMMGTAFIPFRKNVMFPVYGALTLCRWLTFKTCRKPVFPPEIEAECQIDPEDPYRLPEPRFMAEFASDPAIYARALERHKERVMWRPEN
ncbi:DUF6708 domain-containing protein [Stenotrophomonas sp. ZAC14A_NAIMI4_1]|uniref:DUF6708 domain-containing protein n=1 Tax=Stenotrophomonas sp. ZAC14A_NAIMI4_1 TaxID=2072412 RepID=UPI00131EE6CB|nr:DUF6708 domain-containing protein [Stenotrophomonas sp. ZAC14A_NAIMI4_1]